MLEKVSIRKMKNVDQDYSLILKWYKNNAVTEYFHPIIKTKEEAVKKYLPRIRGENNVVPCIIELDKIPVGYVQYYPVSSENIQKFNLLNYKNIYGIDIFIGENNLYSKGIGSKSLKVLINYLFSNKNVDIIIVDPEIRNKMAINCYKKAGFVPYLEVLDENKEKLILYIKGVGEYG